MAATGAAPTTGADDGDDREHLVALGAARRGLERPFSSASAGGGGDEGDRAPTPAIAPERRQRDSRLGCRATMAISPAATSSAPPRESV